MLEMLKSFVLEKKLLCATGLIAALAVLVLTKVGGLAAAAALAVGAVKAWRTHDSGSTIDWRDVAAPTIPGLILWALFDLGGGTSAQLIELIAP